MYPPIEPVCSSWKQGQQPENLVIYGQSLVCKVLVEPTIVKSRFFSNGWSDESCPLSATPGEVMSPPYFENDRYKYKTLLLSLSIFLDELASSWFVAM